MTKPDPYGGLSPDYIQEVQRDRDRIVELLTEVRRDLKTIGAPHNLQTKVQEIARLMGCSAETETN